MSAQLPLGFDAPEAPRTSRAARITHGHARVGRHTPEYRAWRSMFQRCFHPSQRCYARYGGRGITVCERWQDDYLAFFADMGPKPSPAHSLERIDNEGNYEPGNCRWATASEQARNTRRSRWITVDGVERTLVEWSEISGLTQDAIAARLDLLGWDPKRAVSQPLRKRRSP